MLAPVSRGYSPLEGRLVTCYSPVRHFTHGLLHFLVRLACVRHAASVDSEPGSNSRLKPENVLRRRSEDNHQARRLDGGNNYVRSLELKSKRVLTTGMFNLVVKDPITIRTGRRFRSLTDTALGRTRLSSKPFKHTASFTVLSTCEQTLSTRSTGFGSQIASPNARDICRSSQPWHMKNSAQRHRSVSI